MASIERLLLVVLLMIATLVIIWNAAPQGGDDVGSPVTLIVNNQDPRSCNKGAVLRPSHLGAVGLNDLVPVPWTTKGELSDAGFG